MKFELNDEFLVKFGTWYMALAKDVELDAGFNGAHNDGGAGRMRREWEIYLAGYYKKGFPFHNELQIFNIETDPEYAEYLRLKEKFDK